MGLLGKFFRGPESRGDQPDSRAKRGRAQSIRAPSDRPKTGGDQAPAPLPEIVISDIEQSKKPAAPAADATAPAGAGPKGGKAKGPAAAATSPKAPAPAGASAAVDSAPAAPAVAAAAPERGASRMQSHQKQIGEMLIQAGAVSTEQLSRALRVQEKSGKGLVGQILVSMGACPPAAILAALNRQFRISTMDLERVEIPADVIALVPEAKCREHRLMPFEKIATTLCVAMANCLNRKAVTEIEETTKLKVKPFNSTWIDIRKTIEKVFQGGAAQPAQPAPPAAAPPAAVGDLPPIEVEPSTRVPQPAPAPEAAPPAEAPADDEAPPFVGRLKAHISGLDTLGSDEAEVVQETERGLASRHQDEIRRRRTAREKIMGSGKGVTGRLVVHDPENIGQTAPAPAAEPSELVAFRLVEDPSLAGAELPVARQLAASVAEFRKLVPEKLKPAAEPLPAVPAIAFTPKDKELAPVPISDEEWAAMQGDLELDPVVAWEATYASAGPVPAAQSWL